MRIVIKDIIGTSKAFGTPNGRRIQETYGDRWRSEPLELDFTGIENVSPSFLSQAVMPILMEIEAPRLEKHLRFTGKPRTFDENWNKVVSAIEKVKARQASR